MQATPWSLDEFAAFDVFATSPVLPAGNTSARGASPDAIEAEMEMRFAAEAAEMPITFALLLNLVSAANAESADVLWGFISRYVPGASARTHPDLDKLARHAVRYFQDFVAPTKTFRAPTDKERAAMEDLARQLAPFEGSTDAEALQNLVFEVGKAHQFEPLRDWFTALYQVLLGADQGPRFGSFVALYGVAETRRLIAEALAGKHAA